MEPLLFFVPVVVGVALGTGVFWVLKTLTRLPRRSHAITHVVVRVLSGLTSLAGVFWIACVLAGGDKHGDGWGAIYFFSVAVFAGIPALAFGAGLGQSTRRR